MLMINVIVNDNNISTESLDIVAMCQKDHVKLFDIYYSNLITIFEHFNKKYRKLNQTQKYS